MVIRALLSLTLLAAHTAAEYSLRVTSQSPARITVWEGNKIVADNTAILSGPQDTTAVPVSINNDGSIVGGDGTLHAELISPNVARIQINTSYGFTGAQFSDVSSTQFFGTWEYPWSGKISNNGVAFDLKGTGDSPGINWSNARAPFFLSVSEYVYGVYADTLTMGSYDFKSSPEEASYVFNSSSLTYYIILPSTPKDVKSVLTEYTKLSASIELPPVSGLGPTFWSDDFEMDFHGSVSNAQENYYDVVNHLYDNEIRANSMFADRPYGTGDLAFGNFDFDPKYYPTPEQFIANLSDYGLNFQVWVANRAFEGTELYSTSIEHGWLLEGHASQGGPALDLTIPEAYAYFKERLSYFPSVGVRGYKIDRGEEEEMPAWQQNIQMALFEQLCYETMTEKWGSSSEFYTFARSAVDRSRKHTHIWNGDAIATYTGLAYSVASGIRSGLVGFPIWGSDTGGYVRSDDSPSEQLWARWMWFSAFSPVYELMLGTEHTPWYAPYTDDLVATLKTTANLHHELIPYIMSYANTAKETGVPIMRALFVDTPDDLEVYAIADEYFFGEQFLVAPVVADNENRMVYFPVGGPYLEYFQKKEVYEGGTSATIDVPLDTIPVFVVPGAIVPRGDIYQGNNKWALDWKPYLDIELFPSRVAGNTTFAYWTGEDVVDINMSVDCVVGIVNVEYGKTGAMGKLKLYAKDDRTLAIQADGGTAVFDGVNCIF